MRIDKYLSEQFGSRTKAAAAVSEGLVLVNGKVVKVSYEVMPGDNIELIDASESYVSVGGFKLAKALKDFDFNVTGKIYADIGASTGGFTDCLLQNGVSKVYCIDVGESQLDERLLCEKTVVIDNFNARNLNSELFKEQLDGIVIDVSFISLTYILGAVSSVLKDGSYVIALIKPQFECENKKTCKNGIIKDAKVHEKILRKICTFADECGLVPQKLTNAPIIEGKNKEYLVLLEKNSPMKINTDILIKTVKL